MPLVPPYIEALKPYVPGRNSEEVRRQFGLEHVVKLASNENPLGPSPLALEAIHAAAGSVHLYPQSGLRLREALAKRYGVKVENVIAGSGSDSIIAAIVRTFLCDDDEILTTEAAFGGFQVTAKSRGVPYRTVPYRDWHYDLDALADAVTDHTKIIYLANPNNPTGTIFGREDFERFYKHVPERVLIILDEAYFEYAKDNPRYPDSMHYRLDNVITLRTFSKVYGLAGLRVGYGFAHEDLIRNLLKVKMPFEPGTLAEAAAVASLEDSAFVERSLAVNASGLRFVQQELRHRGISIVASDANFVMANFRSPEEANKFTGELLVRGVIVRPLISFGLPSSVRISIGTDEDNRALFSAFDDAFSSSGDHEDDKHLCFQ
ncbi:MAG TPA: histidinol-phosphate transaminase [Bryobacteraceae bacterium]|nr:histidinol-phosphate transaminase [Bryobacteraceae bacterium]